jgi:hypothetical protein
MLQQTKRKDFIGIIKSGLFGAFALTGFSIILVIALANSQAFSSLVKAVYQVVPSILELFIIIAGIGFILGLILRWRFPIIQRGIFPLVIAIIMVAFPLGFIAWVYYKATMQVDYPPQEAKLADCTNYPVNIHLKIPRGHAYQLELKTPETQIAPNGDRMSSYKFSGYVRISNNGVLLADIPIGSDKAWLTASSYVLTGVDLQNTNVPPLSKFIQSEQVYDFEINLEPPPPSAFSLWLYWREAKIDK